MTQGEWIDKALSGELPVLRDGGEGQRVEFKREYPSNASELSKEIAAFASSNAGKIIIGVTDDGELVGLDDLDTPVGRDQLARRIEGLCTNNVKPAITPVIKYAQEDGKNVLVIEVPRGQQPIYYSHNRPYVRHHSTSRPAEPHEVIERIIEWYNRSPLAPRGGASEEETERSQFLSTLAQILVEVIAFGEELEARNVNPWLEELRFQLGDAGRRLRELAAEDVAVEMRLDDQLRGLGDSLERAESHRLALGRDSWAELERYIAEAVNEARQIKSRQIDSVPLSQDSVEHLGDVIRKNVRQLEDLDNRAERMANDGRMKELQSEASEIGFTLLRVSYFPLIGEPDAFAEKLRVIGKDLHLLETERLYMDGGASMRRILSQLHDYNERLKDLVSVED